MTTNIPVELFDLGRTGQIATKDLRGMAKQTDLMDGLHEIGGSDSEVLGMIAHWVAGFYTFTITAASDDGKQKLIWLIKGESLPEEVLLRLYQSVWEALDLEPVTVMDRLADQCCRYILVEERGPEEEPEPPFLDTLISKFTFSNGRTLHIVFMGGAVSVYLGAQEVHVPEEHFFVPPPLTYADALRIQDRALDTYQGYGQLGDVFNDYLKGNGGFKDE